MNKENGYQNLQCIPANINDIEGLISLRELLLNAGNNHYSLSSTKDIEVWRNAYRSWLVSTVGIDCDCVKIYVVHDECKKMIACATGIIDERAPVIGALNGLQGWIQSVVVTPEYRCRGIASSILDCLFCWFRSQSVKKIALQTTPMAYRIYEKSGFEESGENLLIKYL